MKLRRLASILGLLTANLVSIGSAWAAGPPRLTHTYPREAVLVPLADAATLQEALDTHGIVRLERGHYGTLILEQGGTGPAPPLVIRSGQQIYGLRSGLPPLTIEPGATGIILSNLLLDFVQGAVFPRSDLVTRLRSRTKTRQGCASSATTASTTTRARP